MIKKILRFVVDLLAEQDKAKKTTQSGSGTPKTVPRKPKGGQNSKVKPSQVPQANNSDRLNTNAGTAPSGTPPLSDRYPGDYTGRISPQYSPELDGEPDPGEIVWTWVPYEEDFSQGKDRPVLLVGSDGPWLLGLMLTSKDHTSQQRSRSKLGPRWIDIGSGPWDAQGRDSEIRLDRVIRIHPDSMRREGSIMPEKMFTRIAAEL